MNAGTVEATVQTYKGGLAVGTGARTLTGTVEVQGNLTGAKGLGQSTVKVDGNATLGGKQADQVSKLSALEVTGTTTLAAGQVNADSVTFNGVNISPDLSQSQPQTFVINGENSLTVGGGFDAKGQNLEFRSPSGQISLSKVISAKNLKIASKNALSLAEDLEVEGVATINSTDDKVAVSGKKTKIKSLDVSGKNGVTVSEGEFENVTANSTDGAVTVTANKGEKNLSLGPGISKGLYEVNVGSRKLDLTGALTVTDNIGGAPSKVSLVASSVKQSVEGALLKAQNVNIQAGADGAVSLLGGGVVDSLTIDPIRTPGTPVERQLSSLELDNFRSSTSGKTEAKLGFDRVKSLSFGDKWNGKFEPSSLVVVADQVSFDSIQFGTGSSTTPSPLYDDLELTAQFIGNLNEILQQLESGTSQSFSYLSTLRTPIVRYRFETPAGVFTGDGQSVGGIALVNTVAYSAAPPEALKRQNLVVSTRDPGTNVKGTEEGLIEYRRSAARE